MTVTIDRFVAVIYPLKTIRKARYFILFSTIVSIVYNVPRFFDYRTVEYDISKMISNKTENSTSEFSNSSQHNYSSVVQVGNSIYLSQCFYTNFLQRSVRRIRRIKCLLPILIMNLYNFQNKTVMNISKNFILIFFG